MIIATSASIAPPPTPCNARPMIKTMMDGAMAQIIEATKKVAMQKSMVSRWPKMEEILPQIGKRAVL